MKHHKPLSSKKPPKPEEGHEVLVDWIADVRPSLKAVVEKLDLLIRKQLSQPRYAVKWGKAYYGAEIQGWCIELVAYHVSVNVVFLNGSRLDDAPELGEETRYVKVHDLESLDSSRLRGWIKEACSKPGWAW